MLASTLIPQPHSMAHAPVEEDVHMSFGRFVYCMCFFSLHASKFCVYYFRLD